MKYLSLFDHLMEIEDKRSDLIVRNLLAGKTIDNLEPLNKGGQEKLKQLSIEYDAIFNEMQKYLWNK